MKYAVVDIDTEKTTKLSSIEYWVVTTEKRQTSLKNILSKISQTNTLIKKELKTLNRTLLVSGERQNVRTKTFEGKTRFVSLSSETSSIVERINLLQDVIEDLKQFRVNGVPVPEEEFEIIKEFVPDFPREWFPVEYRTLDLEEFDLQKTDIPPEKYSDMIRFLLIKDYHNKGSLSWNII